LFEVDSSSLRYLKRAAMIRQVNPRESAGIPMTGRRACAVRASLWAEDFLYTGTSALLLLLAGNWPHLWFLACLAFVPLLWRAIRAETTHAIRLGLLFGASYLGVSLAGPLWSAPAVVVPHMLVGTAILAGFGWAIAEARQRWGFNPVVTAFLWIAAEFLLIKAGAAHGLLTGLDSGSGFLYKTGIIFGFLAVSFIVVLVNAILVCAIEAVIDAVRARGPVYPESQRHWDPLLIPGLTAQKNWLVAAQRAPPM
jgi:apolipoprotein N-acyltransferase